ncbi:unnamed protein product [Rotaria sp. Silwood1]|nr:unnamed protein product [Rotaria sp. Silwood1]
MYFDKIQNHVELTCQFSTGDVRDLLRTRDLLSYGQLSYDTILTSIQNSFIYLSDLFPSSQHLSNLYDLCDEYFRTWFDKDDLMISLIKYNELYIHLIEHNYKLITKTHAYASCLFLLESHEVDLNSYDILLSLIKDDNLTKKYIN